MQALRQAMRQRRQQILPATATLAAQALLSSFLSIRFTKQPQHIGIYLASDGEIDPIDIIKWCWQQQKNCYLPIISIIEIISPQQNSFDLAMLSPRSKRENPLEQTSSKSKIMQFAAFDAKSELKANHFNIDEPVNTFKRLVKDLDIILVPLVAFDKIGNRLGRGGGYYDVTFANHPRPLLIGLAYAWQQVDALSSESWDVKLDGIITDEKAWWF